MKWVDEMVQLNDGVPHVKCPLCGKENLDYGQNGSRSKTF